MHIQSQIYCTVVLGRLTNIPELLQLHLHLSTGNTAQSIIRNTTPVLFCGGVSLSFTDFFSWYSFLIAVVTKLASTEFEHI